MERLSSVIYYIFSNHPDSYSLLIERLIKMLYLVDWKHAIEYGHQMTKVEWKIREFEPMMDEKSVEELINILASIRKISFPKIQKKLSDKEKRTISFVIQTSISKDEDELTRLVYSTYPALSQDRSQKLDFADLAEEYKSKVKPLLK